MVTDHPQAQNVTSFEGNITLTCLATGFPAPRITWFHNNTMEDSSVYTSETINVYTTRSTLVKSMAETNDSGVYFCRVAIDGYDDVDSNTLTVLVQGEFYYKRRLGNISLPVSFFPPLLLLQTFQSSLKILQW